MLLVFFMSGALCAACYDPICWDLSKSVCIPGFQQPWGAMHLQTEVQARKWVFQSKCLLDEFGEINAVIEFLHVLQYRGNTLAFRGIDLIKEGTRNG